MFEKIMLISIGIMCGMLISLIYDIITYFKIHNPNSMHLSFKEFEAHYNIASIKFQIDKTFVKYQVSTGTYISISFSLIDKLRYKKWYKRTLIEKSKAQNNELLDMYRRKQREDMIKYQFDMDNR